MKLHSITRPQATCEYAYSLIQKLFDVYIDQNGNPFLVNPKEREVVPLETEKLSAVIRNVYVKRCDGILTSNCIKDIYETIAAQAQKCDDRRIVADRIHFDGENLYYILGGDKSKVSKIVKIEENKVSCVTKKDVAFFLKENIKAQEYPDTDVLPTELPDLFDSLFGLGLNEDEKILLYVYIIACFLPQVNHPALFLHGEKGSSKSTALRIIKQIIYPDEKDLFVFPKKEDDLFSTLSNNYFVAFDNISNIPKNMSDILCQAITNGTVSKRKLYTDNEETTINIHSILAINGIEMSIKQSDLLDRAITIKFNRIPKSKRKTEEDVRDCFHALLPKILGAIFNTLSKALPMFNRIKLKENFRMADFAVYGYCIAKVMYPNGGKQFLAAYRKNIELSAENLIVNNSLIFTVSLLMKNRSQWKGTPFKLLNELQDILEKNTLEYKIPYDFPKNAIHLSRQLSLHNADLNAIGIKVKIGRSNERYIILSTEEQL